MAKINRLSVLNNRYERLLELNQSHHYCATEKCGKYLGLLLQIKKEKQLIWIENRKNPKVAQNLENAKKAVVSLTRQHLFNLTNPIV